MVSNSEEITGNIEDYLNDDSDGLSSISSFYDEELENKLNEIAFSQSDLLILCNRICYVDLTKRNLYYEYEKYIKKLFKKRNYEYIPEKHNHRVHKKFKKTFSKLYTKYYLKWEEEYKKYSKERFLENKRQALEFLNNCKEVFDSSTYNFNISTDTEENSNSEISSQTVIRREMPSIIQYHSWENNDESENSESEQIESDLNDFLHNSINDIPNHNPNKEYISQSYSQFNYEIECFNAAKSQQMTSTQDQYI